MLFRSGYWYLKEASNKKNTDIIKNFPFYTEVELLYINKYFALLAKKPFCFSWYPLFTELLYKKVLQLLHFMLDPKTDSKVNISSDELNLFPPLLTAAVNKYLLYHTRFQ